MPSENEKKPQNESVKLAATQETENSSSEISSIEDMAQGVLDQYPVLLEGGRSKEEAIGHIEYLMNAFDKKQPSISYEYLPLALGIGTLKEPDAPEEIDILKYEKLKLNEVVRELSEKNSYASPELSVSLTKEREKFEEEISDIEQKIENFNSTSEGEEYQLKLSEYEEKLQKFNTPEVGKKVNDIRKLYWVKFINMNKGMNEIKELENAVPDEFKTYVTWGMNKRVPEGEEGKKVWNALKKSGYDMSNGYEEKNNDKKEELQKQRQNAVTEIRNNPNLAFVWPYIHEKEPLPIPAGEEGGKIRETLSENGYKFNLPGSFTAPVYDETSYMGDASRIPKAMQKIFEQHPGLAPRAIKSFIREALHVNFQDNDKGRFNALFLTTLEENLMQESGNPAVEQRKKNALWYLIDRDLIDIDKLNNKVIVTEKHTKLMAEHIDAYWKIKKVKDLETKIGYKDKDFDELKEKLNTAKDISPNFKEQMNPDAFKERIKRETRPLGELLLQKEEELGKLNRDLAATREEELYKKYGTMKTRPYIEALGFRLMHNSVLYKMPTGAYKAKQALYELMDERKKRLEGVGARNSVEGGEFGDHYYANGLMLENLDTKEQAKFSAAVNFVDRINERVSEIFKSVEAANTYSSNGEKINREELEGWDSVRLIAERLLRDTKKHLSTLNTVKEFFANKNGDVTEADRVKTESSVDAYSGKINSVIWESKDMKANILAIKKHVMAMKKEMSK